MPQRFSAHQIVLGTLCVLAAFLALFYAFPPLVDWSEHLAQDAFVAHRNDLSFGARRYYESTGWFLPYQGFRILHGVLLRIFGSFGDRLALLSWLLVAPLAYTALLQRMGRSPWVAVASFTLLVEANFLWGFLPYSSATALAFASFWIALRLLEEGQTKHYVALPLSGLVLFFTHSQVTGFWGLTLTCTGIFAGFAKIAPWRRVAAMHLAMAPGGALLLFYLAFSGWITGAAVRGEFAIAQRSEWTTPKQTIALLPLSAGLDVHGTLPLWCFFAALAGVALGAFSVRDKQSQEHNSPWKNLPILLFVLWVLCLFALPSTLHGQSVAPRFASTALFSLLWLAPWHARKLPKKPRLHALAAVLVTLSATVSLLFTHRVFWRFDASMRPLHEAFAMLPSGARVLPLSYRPRPEGFKLPVTLRFAGYAVAHRGVMAASGFTRTGVTYAADFPRNALLVNELWWPSLFGWQPEAERYAPHFDFVLVRTGPKYPGHPFSKATHPDYRWQRIYARNWFELWRIEPTASRHNH